MKSSEQASSILALRKNTNKVTCTLYLLISDDHIHIGIRYLEIIFSCFLFFFFLFQIQIHSRSAYFMRTHVLCMEVFKIMVLLFHCLIFCK